MIYNVYVDKDDKMISFFERKALKDEYQVCVYVDKVFESLFVIGHEYEIPKEGDTFTFEKEISGHKTMRARRAEPEEIVIVQLTKNDEVN